MRDIKVALRYAKSLLGIAIENKALDELYSDMQHVQAVCDENKSLVLMLKSPIIQGHKKQAILDEVFGGVSTITKQFIQIIVSKKREGLLADISASFLNIYKEQKGIKTAQVTSAIPLTASQKEGIVSLLKDEQSNSIDLEEVVDPSIIGGMILRVGDKQIDESIKRKLTALEMEFDDNPYIKEI